MNMKRMRFLSVAFFLSCLLSCSKDELNPYEQSIIGSWRLYERGSSPGSGYSITPIPAEPLQSLTFRSNGQFDKQGDKWIFFEDANYYRIDSTKRGLELWTRNKKRGKDEFSYRIQFRNDTLILSPYCFEGCHFGLVRIR